MAEEHGGPEPEGEARRVIPWPPFPPPEVYNALAGGPQEEALLDDASIAARSRAPIYE